MPRNKHPEETVQIILDSAMKVFLEKGYEKTTILDIVAGMGGLTRGAFYHHFKSKEEVLDAIGDNMFFLDNPFEKAKEQKDLNGLEKLQYSILYSTQDSDKRQIDVMSIQALKGPVILQRLLENNRIVAKMYQELIEMGIADGSIEPQNPALMGELITILTNFWTIPTIFPSSPEESIEKIYFIKDVLDKLGLPILDDKTMASVMENAVEIL